MILSEKHVGLSITETKRLAGNRNGTVMHMLIILGSIVTTVEQNVRMDILVKENVPQNIAGNIRNVELILYQFSIG